VPLARTFLTDSSLTRSALPVLEELAVLSGETTCLYVRQGFDRVVVQRVEGAHPMRYTIRVGQRLPLLVGAAGLVLAAAMPEEELRQLLDRVGTVRLATGEMRPRGALLARLEDIRLRGIAISREEREAGVVSVAAPVTRHARGTIAAISVAGPPARMDQERVDFLSVEVRQAAQRIAEGYGH
jgi:IclR family acetate operon transcriptional repressor